jgi:SAM-dependent methyltransferase
MSDPSSYLPEVRAQYEALPYPPRDPADERKRLVRTWLDALPMLDHYGFGGRGRFDAGFRVLVAGGGTGDGTIFLAEQLRAAGARVVHLDLSTASLSIAQARARERRLENIDWVHASLLDLPSLGLGPFDYVNCSGVLHHLADPDAGLQALLSVLAPDGVLGLMVYASVGRIGVYQLQQVLRTLRGTAVSEGSGDAKRGAAPGAAEGAAARASDDAAARVSAEIARARELLAHLPASNLFKRTESLHQDHKLGDAGLYDLLLHSTDRAYTVPELYAWLADRHGLSLAFTDVGRGAAPYDCAWVLGPRRPALLQDLAARPLRERQAVAELLGGTLITHSLYATRGADRVARYGDPDMVPFFCNEPVTGPELSAMIHRSTVRPLVINHAHTGFAFELEPGQYGKFVLKYVDGQRSFAEIFALVRTEDKFRRAPPDDAALFADFEPIYRAFNAIDRLLLRQRAPAAG